MQDLTKALRPCIGIIAGAGPDAGLAFWRKLLAETKRLKGADYRGDLDAPRVRVVSEPDLGLTVKLDGNRDALMASLLALLDELNQTCHQIVVACHALQGLTMEAAVAAGIEPDKIMSLPDLVCDYTHQNDLSHVGLLGAPSVTADPARSPYAALWNSAQVDAGDDPAKVLELILDAKRMGPDHPEILRRLTEILSTFSAKTILLACTDFSDLPLNIAGKEVVDILDIAANASAHRHCFQ